MSAVRSPLAADQRAGPQVLRVCVVAPSMAVPGGQAVQALNLIKHLNETPGLRVTFLANNPELRGVLGVLSDIRYVRTIPKTLLFIVSLLRRLRDCDVVHVFSASYWSFIVSTLPALLIGRLYGKGVLLNYHSGELEDHLARWRTLKPMLRLAHRIVVPSGFLVDVFSRAGIESSAIANYVDTTRPGFRRRHPLRPVILANRAMQPLYDNASMLRAFAAVQASVPAATLVVANDGPQRRELEEQARELGLRNVTFVGSVPPERMAVLYDEADIYVNTSTIDNMPLSIIEAFAAGLPVVSTNAGGIPYIVDHGRTGILVPCGDHDAMAGGILGLLADPARASRIAHDAHAECTARYEWPAVRDRWRDCYDLVASLAAAPRGSPLVGARPPASVGA